MICLFFWKMPSSGGISGEQALFDRSSRSSPHRIESAETAAPNVFRKNADHPRFHIGGSIEQCGRDSFDQLAIGLKSRQRHAQASFRWSIEADREVDPPAERLVLLVL